MNQRVLGGSWDAVYWVEVVRVVLMTRDRSIIALALMLVALLTLPVELQGSEQTGEALSKRAAIILERNCLHCHRGDSSASRAKFDVRSAESMMDAGVVVAGEPESSLVWELAHRGTMPPRSQGQLSRLTPADAQVVADWIAAGANEFPASSPRDYISLQQTLAAIQADLQALPDQAMRSRQRYFSLVEASNNSAVTDDALRMQRAALSKALNSLSWQREIVVPRAINASETLYAVDIEQLGWTRDHWIAVRVRYPYAIGFQNLADPSLAELEREIIRLSGDGEPLYRVRVDWFVSTALQPELYHTLLYDLSLPELTQRPDDSGQLDNPKRMTAADLERYLEIDLISNFHRGGEYAIRSGFTASGVSGQNRLLERHRTKYGAYWKSYDFKADNRRSILTQFPLGPNFPNHPQPQLVFEHDGGEVIFHLPNGLQGYLLVDGADRRIDSGPIEVVSDVLKTSGTPTIVTGVSCFACHKLGMISAPPDEVRQSARVFDRARDHVQRLYSPLDVFERAIDVDGQQFMNALELAIGSILLVGDDQKRSVGDFPEPVFEVARPYLQDELNLAAIAAELHEPNVERLRVRIENSDVLLRLGMGVLLLPDGHIKRAYWEGKQGGPSIMQLTAFALDFTIPSFIK